jgi:pimeloyl-ACP methyl ester carboxylesterase
MAKTRVGDVELYYETAGQGPPIVFIHGLGSSTRDWDRQVEYFSKHFRVIVFDVRGHGRSDRPSGPYSVPLFARDTAELIRSLEGAPAHVVGVSMGGMIGLQLAIDSPELVSSLVVVNAGPEVVPRTIKERLMILQRFLIVRLLGMRRMALVLAPRLFPKPEQEGLRHVFVERWAANDRRAYLDALRAVVGWSVRDRLTDIGCPVLVVAADQDYTPVEQKAAFVAEMRAAELVVIEDSRHATPIERPHEFNDAVAAFLDRSPVRPS